MRHQVELIFCWSYYNLVDNGTSWHVVILSIISANARISWEESSVMTFLNHDHSDFHLFLIALLYISASSKLQMTNERLEITRKVLQKTFLLDRTYHCFMFNCHDLIKLSLGNTIAEVEDFGRQIAVFLFEHLQMMSDNVPEILDDFNFRSLQTPAHVVTKGVRIMRRRNTNNTVIEKHKKLANLVGKISLHN